MDAIQFLKRWEANTGLYLVGENRNRFLRHCDQILYLERDHLEIALRTAARSGTIDLKYIEAVALNVRRSGDSTGDVIDFVSARQKKRALSSEL